MFRIACALAFLVFVFSNISQAQVDNTPTLEIRIEGIKGDKKGEIGVAVFKSRKGFPIHIEHAYETKWDKVSKGEAVINTVFDTLPAGEYAVSVIHDVNGNRMLERSMLGFPEEGVGFSNDQKVKLSAPEFKDCKFMLADGEHKKIVITLDYRE